MPGIRINNPVGAGWEYSLDQLTWQTQPLFSARVDGTPFVVGTTYTIYYRNTALNKKGLDAIVFGQRTNDGLLVSRLLRLLSPADWAYICSMLPCRGDSTEPKPTFTFAHYELVDDPAQAQPDYVLGDGTYAGTFDSIDKDSYGLWALQRGVGPVNVDLKWRRRGTTDTLQSAGDALTPNFDRSDVIAAPGVNTPGAKRCGRSAPTPDALKVGYEIEVYAFIAGTGVALKSSPRFLTIANPVQPTGAYRIDGETSIDAGGLGKQQTLQQQYSDGQWRNEAGTYRFTAPYPDGLTVTDMGVIQATANSVTQTGFYTLEAVPASKPALTITKKIQIVFTGCTRPSSGLTTYTAIYALAPAGGNSSLFDSLEDANTRMGAHYDNTAAGNPSTFKCQVASLTVGQKVYNRDDINTCELVSDNVYYLAHSNGTNTIRIAIRTKDGVIVAVLASAYTTPLPKPDTSWSNFSDPCDVLSNAYVQANGSVWSAGGGKICQSATVGQGDSFSLVLGDGRDSDYILAKVTPGGAMYGARIGVGLKYDTTLETNGTIKGGYCILLTDTNRVTFLFDHNMFGPTFDFGWQMGQTYWMAMRYVANPNGTNATLYARAWKVTETEPADWPWQWWVYARQGLPALIGGSNPQNPSTACFDEIYLSRPALATPGTLQRVARGFVAKPSEFGGYYADVMYFVDNGTEPGTGNEIKPTYAFRNVTTNVGSLDANSAMYPINSGGNSVWAELMEQARAAGYKYYAYANAGQPGQNVRFRMRGQAQADVFMDFDFTIPSPGTSVPLTQLWP